MYVSSRKILYVIKNKKYFDNINSIRFNYANKEMEEQFKPFVLNLFDSFESNIGYIVILEKEENSYPLSEILKNYNGKIPHSHVAWIISRLNNLVCFLKYNNLSHNGITIDNIFINPENHTIYLYGGWWYTKKINTNLIGVCREVYDIMSPKAKTEKVAYLQLDTECVKQVARQLLGSKKMSLLSNDIPKQFSEYLKTGAMDDSIKEFSRWEKTLKASYGERKFIEMKIDTKNIYTN